MNRRRVLAGAGLAAFGVFLLVVPVASTTTWDGQLSPSSSVDIAVPGYAAIAGTPIEVELYAGTPQTLCYGYYCPVQNDLLPHYFTVSDCGVAACSPGMNGSEVGSTPTSPPSFGFYFWASQGHHYRITGAWAWPGMSPNASFPLKVVIVTPWLSGAPGIVALVGAAWAITTGVRTPNRPRPGRLPSAAE